MKYEFLGKPNKIFPCLKTGKIYDLEVTVFGGEPTIVKPIYCPYSSWFTFCQNWKPVKKKECKHLHIMEGKDYADCLDCGKTLVEKVISPKDIKLPVNSKRVKPIEKIKPLDCGGGLIKDLTSDEIKINECISHIIALEERE